MLFLQKRYKFWIFPMVFESDSSLLLDFQNFHGSKVLVTGGLGFIGSNLACRLVELGAEVTIIDSLIPEYGGNHFNIDGIASLVDVHIADIRDSDVIEHLIVGKDYLFNLAAQTSHSGSMRDPKADLEINALAQLSILECCRKYNPHIKIVFSSTRQVYGVPQYLPVDELHPVQPVDVNGINKLSGEWYHLLYKKVYNIDASVIRMTNVYGPRMRVKDARQTFLGIWIKNLIDGKPIDVFGDGLQIRDFNYVDDVVLALLNVVSSPKASGELFNIGSPGDRMNLKSLAELLIKIHGHGTYNLVEFPPARKAIDIGNYYTNHSKISEELGWKVRVSFEEGLSKTLKFYTENKKYYWQS
jgi:UDP-glucose 4-epimerase